MIDGADMTTRSPRRRRPTQARASRAAVGYAGLALLAGGACGNSTLDLFDPDVGLLAHWALDESQSGTAVVDSSGFGLDATPSTNPPTPTRDVGTGPSHRRS